MPATLIGVTYIRGAAVFICYAHADNDAADPRVRWLDRLLTFLRPLTRQDEVTTWSDRMIETGSDWDSKIQQELKFAHVAILLVSPSFLASDYIARSELPVLLKRAKHKGMKILPVIISPCLFEESRFRYPHWKTGPHEIALGSLQSINPPSRTLVEMTEGEQNRVLLSIAHQVIAWVEEARDKRRKAKLKKLNARMASLPEKYWHQIVEGRCIFCKSTVEHILNHGTDGCYGRI